MHAKKLGFLLSMALVASAILATRIQEVDVPIWQRFADANRVNPLTLHLQGEFVESNLGTAREPDGSFTLRMIAEQYMFVPHCALVPAGVPVAFTDHQRRRGAFAHLHRYRLRGESRSRRG
jgi:hypothetical protein